MTLLASAASEVASTPVGLLAFVGAIALIGGFLGGLAAIRRYIVKPIGSALERVNDIVELPAAMRDLAETFAGYVRDNEAARVQQEKRLHRVENFMSLFAFRVMGPPPPGGWPVPPPAADEGFDS